jgi:hypothetical protein
MALSRSEIAAMSSEERAAFYTKTWGLIKKACDVAGPDAQAALTDIKPSLYGIGGTRVGGTTASRHVKFYELFKNVGDKVNELDVFKALKIGEREAMALIKTGLQKADPKDRVWVSFKEGVYTLEGKGADMPKTYNGFKPTSKAVEAPKAPKAPVPGQPVK